MELSVVNFGTKVQSYTNLTTLLLQAVAVAEAFALAWVTAAVVLVDTVLQTTQPFQLGNH
jgi:hypothetical protein